MEWDDPINLSDFLSSVDDPRLRPDPYALTVLSREIEEFTRLAEDAQINANFTRRIRSAVCCGLRRLDCLPRDDPFWEGTNRRPTFFKLPRFCAKLLEMDHRDSCALWTRAACDLLSWQNSDPKLWRQLVEVDRLDASWPIHAALFGYVCWAADTVGDLVSLLDEAGLCDSARPTLEQLGQSDKQSVRKWTIRVAKGCQIGAWIDP